LHLILMSTDGRIPLGMGWFKLERDQARAAAWQHPSCQMHERHERHERALTHDGQAVGGVQSGAHDVSFEMCLLLGFMRPSFISKLDNGRNSKESLLPCQHPATIALLPICGNSAHETS